MSEKFEWPRATPEAQGVDSAGISAWVRVLDGLKYTHSFMLRRHGFVIASGWWNPYDAETRHQLFSLSKSFTSLAVGLAIEEKRLELDDPVVKFFPDKLPPTPSAAFGKMTVRHLLTMATGHDKCAFAYVRDAADGDWVRAFLASPLTYEPGSRFAYNSLATYMLSAILNRLTGQSLVDYLNPRLLWPLGIKNAYWDLCPQGLNVGGWGFHLTTGEIANFAQMLLQGGEWRGRQLVPAEYLRMATAFQIDNSLNESPDWKLGYGFQFWRSQHNCYRADGASGQYALVMPDLDMSLAVTAGLGGMQDVLTATWDVLLPAAKTRPLPENPGAQEELRELSAALQIPPAEGSPAGRIGREVYELDGNPLDISRISFNFTGSECEFAVTRGGRTETINAGFGHHVLGKFESYNPIPCLVGGSAGWKSADELELVFCFRATPCRVKFSCRLAGGRLEMTNESNVGFLTFRQKEVTVWPKLTGRRAE